jgi:ABC-type multidrug transport system fused ATPase/permease subunit
MVKSFLKLLGRCYQLALPYGRLKLFALLGLILFNGLLQLIGVTSIFPFFALAADPERIRNSRFGSFLMGLLPAMDNNHLLALAGLFAIIMLVLSSIGSMASETLRIRYAFGFMQWLRTRLLSYYTSRPYDYFLKNNTAVLQQKLVEITSFINGVLLPLGEIISRIVLVLLLIGIVFLVQPLVALGAALLFGGFYLIAFRWIRPRAKLVGEKILFNSVHFAKHFNQFLHGIKTVMVHCREEFFMSKALGHSAEIGLYQSKVPLYSNGPRYLIEPIAFGGLVAVVIVMALQGRPFSDILPNLAVMGAASVRLLPALQLLYSQLVSVAANNYTLSQIESEIMTIEKETESPLSPFPNPNPLTFEKEIRIDHVTFRYPVDAPAVLQDFCLTIGKCESVGIAGPSGSGKSTLVDLILGLHAPQSGSILVDGEPVTAATMNSWRRMIGYVPQDIYLLDETIGENIAFGIPSEAIDEEALREASEGAQILDFVKSQPDGFRTKVGERGVRLSGGQRQRIGLARALYHRPPILILDEATSALDNATEAAVMETIHRLQGKLTMITIAHRLSTLEKCDKTIRLDTK